MDRSRKPTADTGNALQQAIGLLSRLARLPSPKPWLAYALAVFGTALATVLRWWLGLLVGSRLPPYITFYLVPMLAALLGGAGPGLLATVLASLAVQYFFLAPSGSLAVAYPADKVGLALFIAINVAVTFICAALRTVRHHILTEARRAEASEQRLRATFQQAAVGILEADPEDRCVAVNDRACELLGYRPEDLLGRSVHELTHPEDRPQTRQYSRDLHAGRRPRVDCEKRYLKRDGSPLWVHVSISPLYDRHGVHFGSLCTFEDITQRKRAEEALHKQAQLIELAPAATIVRTLEGVVTFWSAGAEALYGWTAQEALGRLTHDLLHTRFPKPLEQIVADLRAATQWSGELRQCAKDGRTVIVESHWLGRFAPDGQVLELLESNMDLTARVRAEEILHAGEARLAQAVRVARLGTFDHDHRSGVIEYSPQLRHILGIGANELSTLPALLERVVPEDRELVTEAIRCAHDPAGNGLLELEHRISVPGKGIRWVSVRAQTFFEGEGAQRCPIRTIGAVLDITEQKELAASLEHTVQERTAKLRETVAELEGFSYSLVHDLRAPLRAMLSYASVLEHEAGQHFEPEHADYLRRIRLAALRMDQLVTDSLNYSKILRQELPLGPVNLGSLIRGMVETYPNLQPPAADVTVECPDLFVHGNQAALAQIFSNLLGNAVKFVAPGVHPRVRVWAEIPASERRSVGASEAEHAPGATLHAPHVLVWVEDNGIGIPKDQRERIFGMFQRLHRADEYPGTGIGLALVRKSLERTGGRVCLDSEPGKGSRFCVLLPLAHQDQQAHAA